MRSEVDGGANALSWNRALLPSALLVALLAFALVACGEKEEELGTAGVEAFDLTLDFYVNPDHAGIYTALANGYFERAGLELRAHVPSDPAAPIKEVAAGRSDLAVSYEPEVLLAQEQDLDVIAVAALVDEPLTSLISLPAAGIAKPIDLQGKTVATAGIPYQTDYLQTILEGAGLSLSDVEEVNVGLNLLPALIGGRADALLGAFRNIEGVDLAQRGLSPSIVPVNQLGVPTYDELVLVASREMVEDDPGNIRLFLGALARGTEDAIANPQAATQSVLDAGQGLDPALTAAEVTATLPLLAPDPGQAFGQMDGSEWELFASWMADHDLIEEVPETDEVLTNELLPAPQD